MTNRLNAPDEFATARLLLRKPRLDDAAALFHAYARDREVVRFVTWRPHQSEQETRGFLELCLEEWSTESGHPYVIEIAGADARPVGMIHLHKRPHRVEFGYIMARSHWGQGYMTEALSALVDWSLNEGTWRAAAFCDVENLASARVLEKADMTFEGILRKFSVHPNISPEPRDCRMYAKVRS